MMPTSKGVFVRSRFDWMAESAAGGGAIMTGVGGEYQQISLYNNDTQGRKLAVYGMFVYHQDTQNTAIVSWQQGSLGALALAGQPLLGGAAAPPGAIYTASTAARAGTVMFDVDGDNGYFQHFDDFPLVILPNGYSLIVSPFAQNEIVEASFIWAPL